MKKMKILINKPVYSGLPILEISKIVMYKFWYDYVKPQYGEKVTLYYMDTDSFIVYIIAGYICKDITEDAETRFDSSNYVLDGLLLKGKKKKVIVLMKAELGGKLIIEFVALRAKAYSYLTDNGSEDKKVKGTKTFVIKRKLKFESCKNCLEANQLDNEINYLEKNETNVDSLKIIKNS